jgi:hypothetical protein
VKLTNVPACSRFWARRGALVRNTAGGNAFAVVSRQNPARVWIGEDVLELVWLLLTTVLAWMRPRLDPVFENVLLRHQLAVLTRPSRARPRVRLKASRSSWALSQGLPTR